jgi:hypothetical protein
MPIPILVVAFGAAVFAGHRSGLLQKLAGRVSVATATYASTHPEGNMNSNSSTTSNSNYANGGGAYRQYEGGFSNPMVYKEAKMMLGFDEIDTSMPEPKEVTKRHRSLMSKFHTDVGGSDMICQKLNQARDTILPK